MDSPSLCLLPTCAVGKGGCFIFGCGEPLKFKYLTFSIKYLPESIYMELPVGCPEEASRDDPDHPSLQVGR